MKRRSQWLVVGTLIGAATAFVAQWHRASAEQAFRAFDIYSYYYPTMLYAVRSLRDGGRGFFWNALQSCGEPFFGSATNALLYPASLLFLVLSADHALYGTILFNLVVSGAATYLLCKELGAGTTAALCGALAFELGNSTIRLATWTPVLGNAYAWLPAALLLCERILRTPTIGRGLGLAVVLALAVLGGHPQVVFFIYQMIVLRVAWELATRRAAWRVDTLGVIAFGLLLAPLLVAVQLVPGIELTRESIRSAALSVEEQGYQGTGYLTWVALHEAFGWRRESTPFDLLPCIVASVALLRFRAWRSSLFYGIVGLLFFFLAFGPNSPLFQLYAQLPLATIFREPERFVWVTSFCLAVLTALGVEAMVAPDPSAHPWVQRGLAIGAPLLTTLALARFSPIGLHPSEWALVGVVLMASVLVGVLPRWPAVAGAAMAAAIVINLLGLRPVPFQHLLPSGDVLLAHAPLFNELRQRMTAQDRAYMVIEHMDFPLQLKTGSLFGVPSLHDYEPQPLRRYSEFFVVLRTGRPMVNINQFIFPRGGYMPRPLNRRLLNLAAGRYIVAAQSVDSTASVLRPPPPLIMQAEGVNVYENTEAMPRAFFVPHVEIVRAPEQLLRRLASGTDDLRQVALVEADLPSGFSGAPSTSGGAPVSFVQNDPEDVILLVHAPQRGFLFLADQHYPGWQATVNGASTPIVRANYAFRLIEVPEGDSKVEFRYVPLSLRVGAVISAVAILATLTLAVWPAVVRRWRSD